MKRRSVLAGITAAVGSAAAVGTGAFDSIEADRSAEVAIEGDSDAYLQLEVLDSAEFPNASFAREQVGLFSLDFNEVTPADSDGPAAHSTYEFDNVFGVTNTGSQEVEFWLDEFTFPEDDKIDEFEFYVGDNPDQIIDGNDGALKLPVGESTIVGVRFETEDAVDTEEDDFEGTASLEASEDSGASEVYEYDGPGFGP